VRKRLTADVALGFGMLVDRFGTPWMVNGGIAGV